MLRRLLCVFIRGRHPGANIAAAPESAHSVLALRAVSDSALGAPGLWGGSRPGSYRSQFWFSVIAALDPFLAQGIGRH